ncbi:MAG: protein-L-isoaspartate(D-aspartate) O-methyltransferase [Paludibacteraceae bacterium]|nr:protein-L-isoaspartate(D-aspartate) O-methyltransferase [Paludibacteraceae bacterium]
MTNWGDLIQKVSNRSISELKKKTAIDDIFPQKEESKYIARRGKLVDLLRKKGISSPLVLEAIGRVPRQVFMPETLSELAYEDKAFPIGAGQTISQPFTVAKETEILDIQKNDKILEIGTGSGYQSAILLECGCRLFSLERQETLHKQTKERLEKLNYKAVCLLKDGFEGLLYEAPFDKIMVTAGASEIPKKLLRQLKIGGIMALPFGEGQEKRLYRIKRLSETDFEKMDCGPCAFVPMLKGINRK